MIHKQEEMEQLELEQALSMSLMVEEERLRQARVEAKNAPDDDDDRGLAAKDNAEQSDAKDSRASVEASSAKGSKGSSSSSGNEAAASAPTFADPKPLRNAPGGLSMSPMKALPPIGAGKKPTLQELSLNYKGMPLYCGCIIKSYLFCRCR